MAGSRLIDAIELMVIPHASPSRSAAATTQTANVLPDLQHPDAEILGLLARYMESRPGVGLIGPVWRAAMSVRRRGDVV
ncbi:hypothetical protein ACFVKB_36940 [Rhodococcus sp. NPDC127530]|uniref:hypothetical protein n=1 Tax=unclassified Rhodococcus (in: high G+C Gram-positive bacteria) TaxID=192944 RepID=UPI003630BC57